MKSIQTQFLAIFISLFVILGGWFAYNYFNIQTKLSSVQKLREDEFVQTFKEIIELKISKPRLFAYDYSYWDEMVEFTRTKDMEWAAVNLNEGLQTFESDYIYVYDAKGQMIYAHYDANRTQSIEPFIPVSDFNYTKPHIMDVFIADTQGQPVELFICPVQNSNDLKRVGKPQGYVVAGKIWNDRFIQSLEQISKQSISIINDTHDTGHPYDIVIPLGKTDAPRHFSLGIMLNASTQTLLASIVESNLTAILVVGLIGITLLGGFIYRRFILPLHYISTTMRHNELYPIVQLMQKQDEFGEISHLIYDFFHQKQTLEEQLRKTHEAEEERLKLENELRQTNKILEQKVNERTSELEQINHTLEERVHSEIIRRREQEQVLIQQSRFAAMGEMIGNIAHQWRQPLNSLSLVLQNIEFAYLSGKLDQPLLQKMVEKSELLINGMSKTIDDFRNFFKPNKQKEYFNIAQSTTQVIDLLHAALLNARIEITTDIPGDLEAYGYGNEFTQVLLNLLQNAKDALLEKRLENRKIGIYGQNDTHRIIIRVIDNGGGIDTMLLDKIFDPYFTTKEEGKGSGIGLYMSKVIIESNMVGKLYADNDGEGAVFTIELPKF